jgi:hypothetical protein
MTVVSTSAKELSRLDVLLDIEASRLSIREACALMGLQRRQVLRLLAAWRSNPGQLRRAALPSRFQALVSCLLCKAGAIYGKCEML